MRSLEQRLQTNSSGAGPGRSVDRAGWAPQEGRAPAGVRGGRVPQRRWAVTRWKAQAATNPSREASPSAPGAALRFPSRQPEPEPEPGKATGTPLPSPRAWGVCLPLPGGHAPCTCGPSSQAREEWKVARFLLRPVLLRPLHSPVLSWLLHPLGTQSPVAALSPLPEQLVPGAPLACCPRRHFQF